MKRGFVSQLAQGLAHLGKCEFGFIAKAEESLGASHLLARSRHLENLVGCHRECARLAWIAAEGAISAVVATKIGEWNKNLARVSNYARLEALPGLRGSREQRGKVLFSAADQLASPIPRKRHSCPQFVRIRTWRVLPRPHG